MSMTSHDNALAMESRRGSTIAVSSSTPSNTLTTVKAPTKRTYFPIHYGVKDARIQRKCTDDNKLTGGSQRGQSRDSGDDPGRHELSTNPA